MRKSEGDAGDDDREALRHSMRQHGRKFVEKQALEGKRHLKKYELRATCG